MTDGKGEFAKAAIAVRDGFTREFVENYIAALLPRGWRIAGKLEMRPAFDRADGGEYLFISAESDRFQHAGVKMYLSRDRILAGVDLQALGAELGNALRLDCESKGPGGRAIRFALTADGARQPTRGTEHASGYDLYAPVAHYITPSQVVVVHIGVVLELPVGFEGQVRPRSSMSKRGLLVQLGTIDCDYRGPIGATIVNVSREAQKIEPGDRIAQLVLSRVEHFEWELVHKVDELSNTSRGSGGFGSTGR